MKFTLKIGMYAAALAGAFSELAKASKVDGFNYTSTWKESDWRAPSSVTTSDCNFAACFESKGDDGEKHDYTLCADSKKLLGELLEHANKSCGIYQTNETDPLLDDCARRFVSCDGFKEGIFNNNPISATLCYHDAILVNVEGASTCIDNAIKDVIRPVTTADAFIFAGIGVGGCALIMTSCGLFAYAANNANKKRQVADAEKQTAAPSAPPTDEKIPLLEPKKKTPAYSPEADATETDKKLAFLASR